MARGPNASTSHGDCSHRARPPPLLAAASDGAPYGSLPYADARVMAPLRARRAWRQPAAPAAGHWRPACVTSAGIKAKLCFFSSYQRQLAMIC